jgi:hypothetical protein
VPWRSLEIVCVGHRRGFVKRTPRFPRYSDDEMLPFFNEVAAGYCYKQAADRCLYPQEWVLNTIYSDDEVCQHMLELSMVAGALIRAGKQVAPKRYDGLYDLYITQEI